MKNLLQIIKEHILYRKQIIKLARADLIRTYRGAALGWAWAIIKPAVTIFVYWFTFSIGLRIGNDVKGYPYFLWLIAGVAPWFYVSDMIIAGTNCIRKYSYLVTKMKFPVSTISTFVNISNIFTHVLLIALVTLIFACFGYMPDIYMFQIPIYMFLMFLLMNAWGLFSGHLAALSKDYGNLVKSFITAVFWMSGIIWNPDASNSIGLIRFLNLNPVTFFTNGFRNVFINKIWIWQQPKRLLYFLICLIIMNMLALLTYKKIKKEIPDVL